MATTKDYRLGEFTYPRGWFMVADAEEITTTPKNERFFGQDVVIYRGESGRVFMVDAGRVKLEIGPDEKKGLTVPDLISHFSTKSDRMLLAS